MRRVQYQVKKGWFQCHLAKLKTLGQFSGDSDAGRTGNFHTGYQLEIVDDVGVQLPGNSSQRHIGKAGNVDLTQNRHNGPVLCVKDPAKE